MPTPLKLTREAHRIIVTAAELGLFRQQAAALAGVDEKTLDRWIAKGRAGRAPFAAFVRALDLAMAVGEQSYVVAIQRAASAGQWPAAAWLLERRHPKRWGLQIRVTVEQEQAVFLEQLRSRLTPAEYARVIAAAVGDDEALSSTETPARALTSATPHH